MLQGLFQLGVPALSALLIAIESNADDPELRRALVDGCAEARGEGSCVDARDAGAPAAWHARVTWAGSEGLRAQIEIGRGSDAGAIELVREVSFLPSDLPQQRHRAVGLIIAAYVAEHSDVSAAPSQDEPPEPAKQPDAHEPAARVLPPHELQTPPEPLRPTRQASFGLDLAGLAGTGLDRGPPRFGAALRAFFRPNGHPLGATIGLRAAHVDAARGMTDQASIWLAGASLGGLAHLAAPFSPLALELRLELLGERMHAGAQQPVTGDSQGKGVWRLGGQLGLEGHLSLGDELGLLLGGGAELLLPAVTIEVGGVQRGRARALGLFGLLGVRWSP